MERVLGSSGSYVVGMAVASGYAFFALVVITLDRFRANSTSKDDTQVELKIVLFGLALMGLFIASDGVASLVAAITSGFQGGGASIKVALAPIAVGGATVAAIGLGLLPRTNSSTARSAEALALLTVALYYGSSAIGSAYLFLTNLVMSGPWTGGATALADLIVHGAIGYLALNRLGALAGWATPVRPPPPPYPPPQGGGYPPQGGGYPPQGGGYPPQGGGYPPQGGGYPPQGGGGYPPPGGGGYPPPGGGGGYPPR